MFTEMHIGYDVINMTEGNGKCHTTENMLMKRL